MKSTAIFKKMKSTVIKGHKKRQEAKKKKAEKIPKQLASPKAEKGEWGGFFTGDVNILTTKDEPTSFKFINSGLQRPEGQGWEEFLKQMSSKTESSHEKSVSTSPMSVQRQDRNSPSNELPSFTPRTSFKGSEISEHLAAIDRSDSDTAMSSDSGKPSPKPPSPLNPKAPAFETGNARHSLSSSKSNMEVNLATTRPEKKSQPAKSKKLLKKNTMTTPSPNKKGKRKGKKKNKQSPKKGRKADSSQNKAPLRAIRPPMPRSASLPFPKTEESVFQHLITDIKEELRHDRVGLKGSRRKRSKAAITDSEIIPLIHELKRQVKLQNEKIDELSKHKQARDQKVKSLEDELTESVRLLEASHVKIENMRQAGQYLQEENFRHKTETKSKVAQLQSQIQSLEGANIYLRLSLAKKKNQKAMLSADAIANVFKSPKARGLIGQELLSPPRDRRLSQMEMIGKNLLASP